MVEVNKFIGNNCIAKKECPKRSVPHGQKRSVPHGQNERKNNSFEMDGVEMVNSHIRNAKMNILKIAMLMFLITIAISNVVLASDISITNQPTTTTALTDSEVKFSVEATGDNLNYRWQYKTELENATWAYVTDDIGTDWNTNTLTIPTAKAEYNTWKFRCVITNDTNTGASAVVSQTAILYVSASQISQVNVIEVEEIAITFPEPGVYDAETRVVFRVEWSTNVEVTEVPDLMIKFSGDGTPILATYINTNKNISLYEYIITEDDYGYLKLDDYIGGNVNGFENQIWMTPDLSFNDEIFATGKLNKKMMITEWTIPTDNTQITLPVSGDGLNITVDWGDDTEIETVTTAFPTHTYSSSGEYDIKIKGTCPSWGYSDSEEPEQGSGDYQDYYTYTQYLTGLKQWGELNATSYGFSYCVNLKYVSGDATENTFDKVTTMNRMFNRCTSLERIDLSKFNTSNVTDMALMFFDCTSLTSLDLSSFNTSKVISMEDMFRRCTSLTSLNVSSFDTSNVTSMNEMFCYLSALTSLDVSNFDTSNVTDMYGMFYYCSSLTSLDLSNFNTMNVNDMNSMFSYCSSLISLDTSNFNTLEVTDMAYMFRGCEELTNLDVSNFATSKVTNMYAMFNECKRLTSLDVSNFDTSEVTDIAYMFSVCEGLTSLDVSGFDTSNVTDMYAMFNRCIALTNLDISTFDTSKATNMGYFFRNCTNLNSALISNKFIVSGDLTESPIEGVNSSFRFITLSETPVANQFKGIVLGDMMVYVPNASLENYKTTLDGDTDEANIQPILALKGQEEMTLVVNATYDEAGYTVAGFDNNSASDYKVYGYNVVIKDGDIDTLIPGDYTITYLLNRNYSGEIYNVATETRLVTVEDISVDAPTNLQLSYDKDNDQITVSWVNATDPTLKYELYTRSGDNEWSLLESDATSSYIHENVSRNTSYEYRLRAYNDAGAYSTYIYGDIQTDTQTPSGDVILDTIKPVVTYVSSTQDKKYLISGDSIEITFEVTDLNYNSEYTTLTSGDIIFKVGTITVPVTDSNITKAETTNGETITVKINSFPYTSATGELSITIPKDMFKDKALNGNISTSMNTGVTVVNSVITTTAPTLDVEANIITVTCNQTTNIEPDNVTIVYEYRKSGDTEFIRSTSNILSGLEGETYYEVRTILEDATGNSAISESAFIMTEKALTAVEIQVISPESGTYAFGEEITIRARFGEVVTMDEVPVLSIKFGDGSPIELTGKFDTSTNFITYKYITMIDDLGELTGVSFVGTITDSVGETIEYNYTPIIGGNKIIARTGVKLIESGEYIRHYPYLQTAIDNANNARETAKIIMLQTEELSDTIKILDTKAIELDLNGKDVIMTEDDATAIINSGDLTVIENIGTGEVGAYGTSSATAIENYGTLNVTGGLVKAELTGGTEGAKAIQNFGTTTIGEDDNDVSIEIPVITSTEYGLVNEDGGTLNFYDGVIEGSINKSYSGDMNLALGYDLITERIANNREKTYLGADKIPPVLKYTILTKGWRKDYVEVEIYAYDEDTGIRLVKVGNEEIELDGLTTTIRITENGEYIVYAEDNASNSATQTITINTIDKDAPVISAITMEQELSAENTEIMVEVQDYASGLAGIILKTVDEMPTNTEEWIEFNAYPTSKQFVSLTLTRNNTYYCFAKDRAGNISRYNDTIVVKNIDKIRPTIESIQIIEDEGKDFVSGKAVIVDVIANDNIEVSEILITNELLSTTEVKESNDWKAYNQYNVHELPVDGDDIYTVYVWVKDATGNISSYATVSVELKALVVGDNMLDYTGSDTIYNKTSLRFKTQDHNYDFDGALDQNNVILRLTLGNRVIRNITTGITLNKLENYDSTDDELGYEGEIYELDMQNLPSTGNLNIVLENRALTDLARNESQSMSVLTDIFVDNNPPKISVTNTGAYDAEGNEIRDITVTDAEGYLIQYIEITNEGTTRTYALTNGNARIPVATGAKITAYDKAGNEKYHTVGNSVDPILNVDAEVQLEYGGSSETISYEYNGDGVIEIVSSDTSIANVAINTDTKQITISPVNAGYCEITLRTTETDNYTEAKRTILVEVKQLPVELSWTTSTFDYDGTRKYVYATVENVVLDDEIEPYKYENNSKINAGTYTAEVVELTNDNYTLIGGTNVTQEWRINKINRTLTLDQTTYEMEMPLTKKLTFTYTGEKDDAEATASNADIVELKVNNYEGSGEVEITPTTIGTTVVTVRIPESTNYNEVEATCDVEVIKKIRIFFDTHGGNELSSQLVIYNREYGVLPTPVKTGNRFLGWYKEETYVNKIESTTIVTDIDVHTLHAKWEAEEYEVTLNPGGGTVTPTTMTVTYGTEYGTIPTPTRAGYTFEGWYTDQTYTTEIVSTTIVTKTSDHTLYAKLVANADTPYTVYHMLENANNSNYTLYRTDNKTGTTDSTITLANEKITITGATYSKGMLTESATASGTATTNTTIAGDGSRKIYLYYTRNTYALTVKEGNYITSVTGGGTYKYEQEINISATIENLSGYTYAFAGWTSSNTALLGNQTNQNTTITMPNGAVTLTANATRTANSGTAYTVYHMLENANDSNYSLYRTDNKTGTTDATVTLANETITITGATYSKGMLTESATASGTQVYTTTVAGDGSTKVYLYYTRNTYVLTLQEGNYITAVTGGGTYKYEQHINISATAENLSGYTYAFAGWTSSDTTLLANQTNQNTTITMPNGAVTLTANATRTANSGTAYTVYHYLENETNTNYTLYETENKTGTTDATITLANEAITITGATYSKGSLTLDGTETTTTTIAGDGSTRVYLYYTRIRYTVEFNGNGDGATVSESSRTYLYGDTYGTLPTATRDGYTFLGWYTAASGGTQILAADTVSASTTVYAQWQADNSAPNTPTVTADSSNKTTSSIPFTITGTDPDGDNLTYNLYLTSSNGTITKSVGTFASGQSTTYNATGLSEYTDYTYYVVATDPSGLTAKSASKVEKSLCPGSTTSCPNGWECEDYKTEISIEYISDCEGTWSIDSTNYTIDCPSCGRETTANSRAECVMGCDSEYYSFQCSLGHSFISYAYEPWEGILGATVKHYNQGSSYVVPCEHDFEEAHWYCDTHGNVSAKEHALNCSHGSLNSHD